MSVRISVESLSGCAWNGCPSQRGIRTLLTLSKQFAGGSAESRLEELKNKHSDQPPDVVMNIFIDELESYYHENRQAILAG
ncbi:hypothetical protein FA571_31650 [Pseudomonas aeruginosa]|nr:hypothetical protein [Pseudomonas aeruginosa]